MSEIVLAIFAHPDDETLACGGTLAKHVQAGDHVHVVVLTDGVGARGTRAGVRQRREAFDQATRQVIGARQASCAADVHSHDWQDQRLDEAPLLDLVQWIEERVAGLRPSIVYTHSRGDLNRDHQIVAEAVLVATRPQPGCSVKRLYAGEVLSSTDWGPSPFQPSVFVQIEDYLSAKLTAAHCYQAELRPWPHPRSITGITTLAKLRGMTVGVEYAEAFELLREIR